MHILFKIANLKSVGFKIRLSDRGGCMLLIEHLLSTHVDLLLNVDIKRLVMMVVFLRHITRNRIALFFNWNSIQTYSFDVKSSFLIFMLWLFWRLYQSHIIVFCGLRLNYPCGVVWPLSLCLSVLVITLQNLRTRFGNQRCNSIHGENCWWNPLLFEWGTYDSAICINAFVQFRSDIFISLFRAFYQRDTHIFEPWLLLHLSEVFQTRLNVYRSYLVVVLVDWGSMIMNLV